MKKSILNLSVLLLSCITFNISPNEYVAFKFLKNPGNKFFPDTQFSFKIKGSANPHKDTNIEKATIESFTVVECDDKVSNGGKCEELKKIMEEIIQNKTTSIEKMGNQLRELFYNYHSIEQKMKYHKKNGTVQLYKYHVEPTTLTD